MSLNKLSMFAVILIAAGLVAWTIFSVESQPGSATGSLHRIVYRCNDGDQGPKFNICAINSDGSGKIILEPKEFEFGANLYPSMNQAGQIVYECDPLERRHKSDPIQMDVCAIRDNGTGIARFSPKIRTYYIFETMLNNKGQVVFVCPDAICFTTINRDQKFGDALEQIPIPSHLKKRTLSPIPINDQGWGLYSCFDSSLPENEAKQYNLCVFNIGRRLIKELLLSSESSLFFPGMVNNLGLIAYTCIDTFVSANICLTNLDGSFEKQLTQSAELSYLFVTDMNNRGDIVFECSSQGWPRDVCAMNINDTEYRQITSGPTDDSSPSINENGVIAYACGNNLCVINFDGTGQRQLTNAESPFGVGNPIIR